jgi:hypothetical protein
MFNRYVCPLEEKSNIKTIEFIMIGLSSDKLIQLKRFAHHSISSGHGA